MKPRSRGQLSVEFVFIVVLWTALLSGMISTFRLSLDRRRAAAVTRFGTWVGSIKGVGTPLVQEEILRALAFLKLDHAGLVVETSRFMATPSSRFYDLYQTRVTGGSSPIALVIQKEGSS